MSQWRYAMQHICGQFCELLRTTCVYQTQNAPKLVLGRDMVPDSFGRVYDDPPDVLVGWREGYAYVPSSLRPPRCLQRLHLGTSINSNATSFSYKLSAVCLLDFQSHRLPFCSFNFNN